MSQVGSLYGMSSDLSVGALGQLRNYLDSTVEMLELHGYVFACKLLDVLGIQFAA